LQVTVSLPGAIQTSPFAVTDKEPSQTVREIPDRHDQRRHVFCAWLLTHIQQLEPIFRLFRFQKTHITQ
jgi:hypothetical protein